MTAMVMESADASVPASDQLYLTQVFGPTFQGEGPSRGTLANFVRFAGCNLTCSWCDTPYTWDSTRGFAQWRRPVTVESVLAYLDAHPTPLLVITGGEPLLHQRSGGLAQLLSWAERRDVAVEFETNGTVRPDLESIGERPTFTVSPKLAHAGDPAAARIVPPALADLADLARVGRARFKFVAREPADLGEVAEMVEAYDLPARHVWIMPEGVSPEAVLAGARRLADPVIARGWNLTQRDHILLWRDDKER